MNNPEKIERQFGLQYPSLYHRLHADGMLTWGTAGPSWITEQYPLLRKDPPLLLFANEFELAGFNEIEEKLTAFRDPGYWMRIRPDLQFIPFAQNGAGDYYCFFPSGRQGEDVPIVLMWHDANRAEYKAGNLQDFIFRAMLEAVADVEEAEYGLLGEENFKEDLQNFLRTHGRYLSPKQQEIVTGIYELPGTGKPLISEEQLQEILEREIGLAQWDTVFGYQNT